MSKNRSARHRKSRVNRSPKQRDEARRILDLVTLDGRPIGWIEHLDEDCPHRGPVDL